MPDTPTKTHSPSDPGTDEAGLREYRVKVRDCIGETIPLRRRWVSAIMARVVAPLLAELAALRLRVETVTRERDGLMQTHRFNVVEDVAGLQVCRGHHDKSEDCDWTLFVPVEAAQAAEARATAAEAERDEARTQNRDLHRRVQAAEGPLLRRAEKAEQASSFWLERRKKLGRECAAYKARVRELEAENAHLRELATAACFHFFCCGAGIHTEDECGQLVPAMADLAKAIGFSSDPATDEEIASVAPSRATLRALSTGPGGGDGR